MIEKIIEYCTKNKFITFIGVGFLLVWGIWCMLNVPLDAIPDLSDVQVIVYTKWEGRSPDLVEDQVTYPIVTTLISAPKVTTVRGFSDFGYSYVYVLFEEGTDIYWARSRVLEYMQQAQGRLPDGVTPTLGPDATGVGWVYEYALVDKSGKYDLAYLRTLQDWFLRYWIASVEGVSEVASIGGFVKQYQVNIDPNNLLAYNLSVRDVMNRIQMSNNDVEGRLLEFSGREYMVRGRGYIKSENDIENIVVGTNGKGTPVLIKDIAKVSLGPDIRRGIVELNGEGEVAGGIVVMRYGENALNVIDRVKKKIEEIKPSLPEGIEIVPTYDRSDLIHKSIKTLIRTLIEEMVIVSLVIIVFLMHLPSAFAVIIGLPIGIALAFIPMYYMKLTTNIMSIGGIAIAIGAMIDSAIIMVENAHKYLEHEGGTKPRSEIIVDAAKLVGRPLFFALLVICVSFLPIFSLQAQEGRLFKPLAFTKTFSMFFAAFLAIILVPSLMSIFIRGKIRPESKNPISRLMIKIYEPAVRFVLRFPKIVISSAIIIFLASVPIFFKLGSEFMPPLYEGTILYMPVTQPGISITETGKLLQVQDKVLKSFQEVESVFGKAGRAETSTDPAPLSMMETVVNLKPKEQWRKGLTYDDLVNEMDQAMQFPGVSNAWTMPIKARIDMLTTGIRTPIGIKISGENLKKIQEIGEHLEMILKDIKGTRSIYAERVAGGYFTDINIRRDEIARYGLTVGEVEDVIQSAIGGMNITTTIEGRERYPVNLRYKRELRDDIDKLKRVLVKTENGALIPLEQLADIYMTQGPAMIRDEDAMLTGYVYIDVSGRDIGGYVEEAKKIVREKLTLPVGYSIIWSGQYEFMKRVEKRLAIVVPLTIFIVFMLLYFNKGSVIETFIVMLAVPFSLVGVFWILYFLNYNMSIGVWVGIIALLGVDAETGVVMLVYLDEAFNRWKKEGKLVDLPALKEAIVYGSAQRIRPKMMTVGALMLGLFPILWSTGVGADVMKRIAAPMVGGIVTSFIMELLIYPAIYMIWKKRHIS